MRYPIRRPLLIACMAIASVAFPAKIHFTKDQENVPAVKTNAPFAPVTSAPFLTPAPAPAPMPSLAVAATNASHELYNDLQLQSNGMEPQVFEKALQGFAKLSEAGKIGNMEKLTIIDFSQPSNQKRLYVIDLDKKQVLFQSLVAHGRGTGALWATSFSNQPSSYKSSPGFYVTQETYRGHNGYSLRLDGLEKGINDNARSRAIVMHGASYANESALSKLGFLGRSEGCPALPLRLYKKIINTIKNGTCLFIYTRDSSYLNQSQWLNASQSTLF